MKPLAAARSSSGSQRRAAGPLRPDAARAHRCRCAGHRLRLHRQRHAAIPQSISSKIEVVYVFPLPEDAAVNDFVMTIGSRTIRGIIRERNEALRHLRSRPAQGKVASLLSQERPNIFTQSVANISNPASGST